MSSMLHLFVYGTLKPGYHNYQRYCEGKVIAQQPAIAQGDLFDLPLGYPAMTSGAGWVKGWLLAFADDTILLALDQLEGYAQATSETNEYDRCQISIFTPQHLPLGTAWTYCMTRSRIHQHKGVYLPQGEWPAF